MDPDELTLDSLVTEEGRVALYRQIFAVLGRTEQSVITDPTLVDLAETLFTAFSEAGRDGMTMEEMRRACRDHPDTVFTSRVRVLMSLGAIVDVFDRPYQDRYRASFTSYLSLLFIRRMLTRGGQLELHRMLTLVRLNLEDPSATEEDARAHASQLTEAFRLIVAELFTLTSGGTIDELRQQAPLLWNAEPLIEEAGALHDLILGKWPAQTRPCTDLRHAVAAYRDICQQAAERLTKAAGSTRALDLLPAEAWRTFTQNATVAELAAPLAGLVFDAPNAWMSPGALVDAVAQAERPVPHRPRPPRPSTVETAGEEETVPADAEVDTLRERAEAVLAGQQWVEIAQVIGRCGDWPTARRVLADLTAAAQHPDLPYELTWRDGLVVRPGGAPSWLGQGRFGRVPEPAGVR